MNKEDPRRGIRGVIPVPTQQLRKKSSGSMLWPWLRARHWLLFRIWMRRRSSERSRTPSVRPVQSCGDGLTPKQMDVRLIPMLALLYLLSFLDRKFSPRVGFHGSPTSQTPQRREAEQKPETRWKHWERKNRRASRRPWHATQPV